MGFIDHQGYRFVGQPTPEPEPESEPESESTTEPESEPEPEVTPEPEGEPKSEPEPESTAEPEGEPEVTAEPESEPEVEPWFANPEPGLPHPSVGGKVDEKKSKIQFQSFSAYYAGHIIMIVLMILILAFSWLALYANNQPRAVSFLKKKLSNLTKFYRNRNLFTRG